MKNLIVALFVFVICTSCSSDDSASSGRLNGFTLQVTGDIETEKLGVANFSLNNLGSSDSWALNMFDLDPQTMSLQLVISSNTQPIGRPEPGSYVIGNAAGSNSVFTATFVNIPDGNFNETLQYKTDANTYGGTLIIEASDSGVVTGSFDFTAARTDENNNVIGEITVSGNFEAIRD